MKNTHNPILCYECTHRRDLFHSCHSMCMKPSVVTADPYGIAEGWFKYPMNFDPTWLETCDGFEQK